MVGGPWGLDRNFRGKENAEGTEGREVSQRRAGFWSVLSFEFSSFEFAVWDRVCAGWKWLAARCIQQELLLRYAVANVNDGGSRSIWRG